MYLSIYTFLSIYKKVIITIRNSHTFKLGWCWCATCELSYNLLTNINLYMC